MATRAQRNGMVDALVAQRKARLAEQAPTPAPVAAPAAPAAPTPAPVAAPKPFCGANAVGATYKGPASVLAVRPNSKCSVRSPHGQAAWQAIQATLAASGGAAPATALAAALPQHHSFIGYAVRRGWLAAVQGA